MGHLGATLKNTEDRYEEELNIESACGLTDSGRAQKSAGDIIPLSYETVSDEVLVGLYIKNGDPLAFTQLIERYRNIILGFAMKMTRNPADAEDIVQEISLILVRKLDTFKGNSKFSTWLYRVTLNTCYMTLKKSKKRKEREVEANSFYESDPGYCAEPPKWAESPGRVLLNRESAGVIEDAVKELSERNSEIFRLKDIEGFTNAQIGEMTGISVSAVKSRLLRSRLFIRDRVTSYFQDNR